MGDMDILFPVPTGGRNADDMGMPAPIKEEKRCIWCEALEGDHRAPVCSGPDGRGHHFRKTPWVTPNVALRGEPLAASPSRKRGSAAVGPEKGD